VESNNYISKHSLPSLLLRNTTIRYSRNFKSLTQRGKVLTRLPKLRFEWKYISRLPSWLPVLAIGLDVSLTVFYFIYAQLSLALVIAKHCTYNKEYIQKRQLFLKALWTVAVVSVEPVNLGVQNRAYFDLSKIYIYTVYCCILIDVED